MANGNLRVITREEFDALKNSKGLIIVDLWADWCGPCRMLTPFIEKFAADLAGRVEFLKLNFDDNRDLQETYELPGIPTLLYFKDGELIFKHSGYGKYKHLYKAIHHFLFLATGVPVPEMSEAEKTFAESAKAAEAVLDEATEPANNALNLAYEPLKPDFEQADAAAKAAHEAGEIDEAEMDQRILTAIGIVNEKLAPAKKVYQETIAPLEAAFAAAIHALAEIARSTTAGAKQNHGEAAVEATGAVCSIDDSSLC